MFFVLSKILNFLLEPLFWLIALLLWAFFTKNQFRRRRILRGCIIYLLIVTNPFISNRVFELWEVPPIEPEQLTEQYDVGIVLGGFSNFGVRSNNILNFSISANRLTDAIALYKMGKIKKILISGGDGRLVGKKTKESDEAKVYLNKIGIPDSAIIIENQSRNTHENALFTKKLLENACPKAKCLLITSAFHMRRAKGCFDKVDLTCQVFPAHFIAEKFELTPNAFFNPQSSGFYNWQLFIKEWIGYLVYKIKAYI